MALSDNRYRQELLYSNLVLHLSGFLNFEMISTYPWKCENIWYPFWFLLDQAQPTPIALDPSAITIWRRNSLKVTKLYLFQKLDAHEKWWQELATKINISQIMNQKKISWFVTGAKYIFIIFFWKWLIWVSFD